MINHIYNNNKYRDAGVYTTAYAFTENWEQ